MGVGVYGVCIMTWYNIGVVCSDSETEEAYLQAMRDQGLASYQYGANGLHLTSYARDGDLSGRGLEIMKGVAKDDFADGIEALLIVEINSDEDTAVGKIYEVRDGVCKEIETVRASGGDVVESWKGISYSGVTVDARRPEF